MTACLRPDVQRAADQRLLVQEAGRDSTHQMCSRELVMPWVRGRARPKEDMGVNAQLAPVALLLTLKKGNEFSKM